MKVTVARGVCVANLKIYYQMNENKANEIGQTAKPTFFSQMAINKKTNLS